jgi:hypothetical protein
MIHDSSFRLEEAMAAVELFDPKMDAGIGAQSQPTVSRLIADGAVAAPSSLSSAALCDLFDALLAREVEYYSGDTFAETVVTCLYVLLSDELPLLSRAIVHGALSSCAHARHLVLQARICVEEDFVSSTQNVELPDIPVAPDRLTADLDAAIAACPADCPPLLLRLQLRRAALVAFSLLRDAAVGGPAIDAMLVAVNEVLRLCAVLRAEVVAADGEPPAVVADLHAHRGRGSNKLVVPASVATVFDAARARRLLRPFPPRHVRRRTRLQAVVEYTTLFTQLRSVLCGLWRDLTTPVAPTPEAAPDAPPRKHSVPDSKFLALVLYAESGLTLAQQFEKQRANVVARSFLVSMLHPEGTMGGWGDARDFVLAGVRGLWSMIDPPLAARVTEMLAVVCDVVPQLGDYVDLLGRVERNLLCFSCSESGQQRRKLGHVIQDYGEMQRRSSALDEAIAPVVAQPGSRELVLLPLFKWLVDRTCTALATHTELSIAHGLFEPWELPQVYWILEHIYQTQHRNHAVMLNFVGRHRPPTSSARRHSLPTRRAPPSSSASLRCASRRSWSARPSWCAPPHSRPTTSRSARQRRRRQWRSSRPRRSWHAALCSRCWRATTTPCSRSHRRQSSFLPTTTPPHPLRRPLLRLCTSSSRVLHLQCHRRHT